MSNENRSGDATEGHFVPPLFWHHLSGGTVLLLSNNRLATILAPGSRRAFKLPPGISVLSLFNGYPSIRVIGRTVYQDAEDMKDPISDHFILTALTAQRKCLARTQEQHWSGVTNVLHEEGRTSEGVIAGRLTSQIRISIKRLEQLSLAYRTVLSISALPQDRNDKSIRNDKYARHIGTEFRSILNELYGFRDAVIAAAYRFKYNQPGGFQMGNFRRLANSDQGPLGRLIAQSMFDQNADLLIDRMSLYRGIALHSIGKTNVITGDGYQIVVADGPFGEIPHLVFPLYDDVEHMREIERGSSKGILHRPTHAQTTRFLQKNTHIDALEFSFDCFVRLLRMAELLASEIGLPSRPMALTDDDIIEATITDEDGKITRLKRDPISGKLGEY